MNNGLSVTLGSLLVLGVAGAQGRQEPRRSIGTISTQGNLIVMRLEKDVLGQANLFNLSGRTLRFTPEGTSYRIENRPLQWDPEFGAELADPQVKIRNFTFPFSGKSWDALSIGSTGTISFGGRVSIGRFDQLHQAARTLVNTVPAICVFLKPRMSGSRHVKELADRAVVTWELTEPFGGIQDFTWVKTINRFQAVLRKDGAIEMSYDQVAAKDAIVGIYPMVTGGAERLIATINGAEHPAVAAHLNIRNVKIAVVDGLFLKVTFETRGPILPAGDPGVAGITYRVNFRPGSAWTIRGLEPQGRGGRAGASRYVAFGPGASPGVTINGKTISLQGILPSELSRLDRLAVFANSEAPAGASVDLVPPRDVALAGVRSPEVHLSSIKPLDGPFTIAYESFHYVALPNPRDLTCTVIKALGDKFDFLAYYSDFRVDNQEAGTPSTGPLGGNVTGIGATQRDLAGYCSTGRFQWQFVQPVYAGSTQMQERPPEGTTSANSRDIAFYDHQLGERSPDRKMTAYNLAMSQIGHEMGHRWSAFVSAKVGGETIPLGPTHWARGLHAPVAFPYQRSTEASAMGGGVWQDNYDGTYTQLDDDYYVPATGWSYLDLYLMGLIAPSEVPDFFILRNLAATGKDGNGHPLFKADRTRVTIQDVIAVEGPRLPPVDESQKKFNTGMVLIVENGAAPSRELIQRTNGIREKWMDYWETTTGHRAKMTTEAR